MGATAAIMFAGAGAGITYKANKQAGKAQAALGDYNASINEIKATDAIARGREAEDIHRLSTRKLIGSQRAAFAASGVDIGDPDSTAVNVFADTAALSEQDALTIRANAAREAWGYRAAATESRSRGRIAQDEYDSKAIGSVISTGGSILYQKYGFASTKRK